LCDIQFSMLTTHYKQYGVLKPNTCTLTCTYFCDKSLFDKCYYFDFGFIQVRVWGNEL